MFGIPDFWIWSSYLLCILSTLACVVYGLYNWNKGGEDEAAQMREESVWEKGEEEVEANL
jgi:nicotinamide riboside transporter PnuC